MSGVKVVDPAIVYDKAVLTAAGPLVNTKKLHLESYFVFGR